MPAAPPPRPASFLAHGALRGSVTVQGDRSISYHSLILGALAVGETVVEGMAESEDVIATARALRAMGATIVRDDDARWHIHGVGVGGLLQPETALQVGDSGTSARLLIGLVASHPLTATVIGDACLSRRSMRHVIEPLGRMGADFIASPGDQLPLMVRGLCPAIPIEHRLPAAWPQVKSAILLAGLNIPGITRVIVPAAARDDHERMLRRFGADLTAEENGGDRIVAIRGEAALRPQHIVVPGDPWLAGLAAVAALMVPGSHITVRDVGLNPARAGLFAALRLMGADIAETNRRIVEGGAVADLVIRHSALAGVEMPPELAPTMIDDPVLLVAAAMARGSTVARGIAELRVTKSHRIAAMVAGLRAIGAHIEEQEDVLTIEGTGGDPLPGGATIATHMDHLVAMSFAVAGLASRRAVMIDDIAPVATGFPGFPAMLVELGALYA